LYLIVNNPLGKFSFMAPTHRMREGCEEKEVEKQLKLADELLAGF
jgi:hypothetical protein